MKTALTFSVLAIWATAGLATAGSVTECLSPGGTILAISSSDSSNATTQSRTNPCNVSLSFFKADDFVLSGVGAAPGSTIQISFNSSAFCYAGLSVCESPLLLGLFSSSTGTPTPVAVIGLPTCVGGPNSANESTLSCMTVNTAQAGTGTSTTITQDFLINNNLVLTVPTGATDLFIGVDDNFFSDNTGNVSVTVSSFTGVPEPGAFALLLTGFAALAGRKLLTKS